MADSRSCTTITDFESPDDNEQWLVVNDGVMGGQSIGDRSFAGGAMVFNGAINTDGGGFSSLRLPLSPGVLAEAEEIVFRARGDGRTYMVTFDDSVERVDRRVSYRAPIEFATDGDWETVSVSLDNLVAMSFGRLVEAEPFDRALATRMGIMLSDGLDGEFSLEIDLIEVCGAS